MRLTAVDNGHLPGTGGHVLIRDKPAMLVSHYYPGENLSHGIDCNLTVYRLFAVAGATIRPANELLPAFPHITPAEPDGAPCPQLESLSSEQKRRLLDAGAPLPVPGFR